MIGYKEVEREFQRLFATALTDETFKKRLLDEPAAVFKEFGFELPDDAQLRVFENTDKSIHFIIPNHIPDEKGRTHWTSEMFEDLTRVLFKDTVPRKYWEEVMMDELEDAEVYHPVL